MSDVRDEFPAALTMSIIRPFDVDSVEAGWSEYSLDGTLRCGFIVKRLSIGYAYITAERNVGRGYYASSTLLSLDFPHHLFERAIRWNTDKEHLNADLPWTKTEANYGTASPADNSSKARPLVRVPE